LEDLTTADTAQVIIPDEWHQADLAMLKFKSLYNALRLLAMADQALANTTTLFYHDHLLAIPHALKDNSNSTG
jgi:hypothetical protein